MIPAVVPVVPVGVRLLGITGAPGVGKSTVAASLGLSVVPMYGELGAGSSA